MTPELIQQFVDLLKKVGVSDETCMKVKSELSSDDEKSESDKQEPEENEASMTVVKVEKEESAKPMMAMEGTPKELLLKKLMK